MSNFRRTSSSSAEQFSWNWQTENMVCVGKNPTLLVWVHPIRMVGDDLWIEIKDLYTLDFILYSVFILEGFWNVQFLFWDVIYMNVLIQQIYDLYQTNLNLYSIENIRDPKYIFGRDPKRVTISPSNMATNSVVLRKRDLRWKNKIINPTLRKIKFQSVYLL